MSNGKIGWLEKLKKQGKIRGYKVQGEEIIAFIGTKTKKHVAKEWINNFLAEFEKDRFLTEVIPEYKFHPKRKWKFDWAIRIGLGGFVKIAIEYEGIHSKKSRHTTRSGYTGDTEKYNAASKLGWTVFRYTANNYKNLEGDLNELVAKIELEEEIIQ